MHLSRFTAFLCVLSLLALASPAMAEVFGSPVDAKPQKAGGAQTEATLKAVARLTAQNRGTDALNLLKNAVDNNLILSDHRSAPAMNAQDEQTMAALNGSQALNASQVLQAVTYLCNQRRGDDAVLLYANALQQGIVQ